MPPKRPTGFTQDTPNELRDRANQLLAQSNSPETEVDASRGNYSVVEIEPPIEQNILSRYSRRIVDFFIKPYVAGAQGVESSYRVKEGVDYFTMNPDSRSNTGVEQRFTLKSANNLIGAEAIEHYLPGHENEYKQTTRDYEVRAYSDGRVELAYEEETGEHRYSNTRYKYEYNSVSRSENRKNVTEIMARAGYTAADIKSMVETISTDSKIDLNEEAAIQRVVNVALGNPATANSKIRER